jgi:hypothetical protein
MSSKQKGDKKEISPPDALPNFSIVWSANVTPPALLAEDGELNAKPLGVAAQRRPMHESQQLHLKR